MTREKRNLKQLLFALRRKEEKEKCTRKKELTWGTKQARERIVLRGEALLGNAKLVEVETP